MTVPYWIQDAIFYQIFPDRFANGDPTNDPPNCQPWGAPPTIWGFQGGDLRGIIQKMDYLLDLGINALYLNPIFLSTSNHRYNIVDYYTIDPRLGTMRDFHALLNVAHENGIRIILDGVFNHCSRGFFPFVDILENQEHSPYRDWFHIFSFPVEAYAKDNHANYASWWNFNSLPKFNTNNPAVRKFLIDVAKYWIDQGADGWRLDVPNEIDDDSFWEAFRYEVKRVNPDCYLVGEIWTADPRWVGDKHFDGLMNYPLRAALLELLTTKSLSITGFVERIEQLLNIYPRENVYAMYNPLGTHDTERILTMLANDMNTTKLAFAFLFAFPGAPAIYYGDEIGLTGAKDPECRKAFPWEREMWNSSLRDWIQKLISLRKRCAALRRGAYLRVWADDARQSFAFARKLGEQSILVVLNIAATYRHLRLPVNALGWRDGEIKHDLLEGSEFIVSGDSLSVRINAKSALWITSSH